MSLVDNKRAGFDYELLEKYEAGLELRGFEVKAIRAGQMQLAGSHVIIRGNEAYLVGATIAPYQANNTPPDYEAGRTIKLLLTTKELQTLVGSSTKTGLTIVPLSVYNKGRRLKLALALAKRKKKHDKREKIKERETGREIRRSLKGE